MKHTNNEVVRIMIDAKKLGIDPAAIFIHANYDVRISDHDTGTHVTITALLGNEKLTVWHYDYWKSSSYDFNNTGKTLGLQVSGPWSDEIDEILFEIKRATSELIASNDRQKREAEEAAERAEQEKIERFRLAFEKQVA